jgi:hypothetical protein
LAEGYADIYRKPSPMATLRAPVFDEEYAPYKGNTLFCPYRAHIHIHIFIHIHIHNF